MTTTRTRFNQQVRTRQVARWNGSEFPAKYTFRTRLFFCLSTQLQQQTTFFYHGAPKRRGAYVNAEAEREEGDRPGEIALCGSVNERLGRPAGPTTPGGCVEVAMTRAQCEGRSTESTPLTS